MFTFTVTCTLNNKQESETEMNKFLDETSNKKDIIKLVTRYKKVIECKDDYFNK